MAEYVFRFAGDEAASKSGEYASLDEARNDAVRYLGTYLSEHPSFAGEGHWRVYVEDVYGKRLLHVIVATVAATAQ